jgi:hypothetical protein
MSVFSGVRSLLDFDEDRSSIFTVIMSGNYQKVSTHVSRYKYELNQTDPIYKYTPLHVAVEMGQKDIVRLILEQKPDLKKKDIFGNTPLDIAMKNHNKELVETLATWEFKQSQQELTKLRNELVTKEGQLLNFRTDCDRLMDSSKIQTEKLNRETLLSADLKFQLTAERLSHKRLRDQVSDLEKDVNELQAANKRLRTSNDAFINASRKKN